MHIPDGFLSPQTYITLYLINAPLWLYSFKQLKIQKEEAPFIATLSGFTYIVTSIQFPLPGGTSLHLTGLIILSKIFGLWQTYLIYSIIFLIQSLVLGLGGITGFPLLCLSMGWFSPFLINFFDKILKMNFRVKIIILNIIGITTSILLISFILSLQPIFWNVNGKPLFFPFTLEVVLPTMFIGHIPVIIIESIVTIIFFEFYEKYYKNK